MAYATQQDCIDRYGNDRVLLSVDRDEDGVIDSVALQASLDAASAMIDSYLGKVIDPNELPMNPPTAWVIWKTIDIAVYLLSADAGEYSEEKYKRYKLALDWLKDVANGDANPGGNVQDIPPPGAGARIVSAKRVFSRESMGGVL